jgi:hypothetical protein
MPIPITCSCGRSCRIKDAFAGRQLRCPACGKVLRVPLADEAREDEEEVVELLVVDSPDDEQEARPKKRDEASRRKPSREESEEPRNARNRRSSDEDEDEARPKKRDEAICRKPSREELEEPREARNRRSPDDDDNDDDEMRPKKRDEAIRRKPSREELEEPREARDSKPASRRKTPRKRTSEGPQVVFEEGWFGSLNAGVLGGVLMMLIAVGWFVAGRAVGITFIYPPILFVLGFIAMIKGMFDRG